MFWIGCVLAALMILSFIFNVADSDSTPTTRVMAAVMSLSTAIYIIATVVIMGRM